MNPDPRIPVIVVGGGLSGIATALGLALKGREAIVLESSDLLGGAAAYSGGMIWAAANHVMRDQGIHDTLELGEAYVRGIAYAHPELLDEAAMHRWLQVSPEAMEYWENAGAITWEIIPELADYHSDAPGALPLGRYLTNAVIDGSELGEWRDRIRVSPNFPVGMTYAEMNVKGRRSSSVAADEDLEIANHGGVPAFGKTDANAGQGSGTSDPLTFGTGVFAAFLARALREPLVSIRLSTPVTDLIVDEQGAVMRNFSALSCWPRVPTTGIPSWSENFLVSSQKTSAAWRRRASTETASRWLAAQARISRSFPRRACRWCPDGTLIRRRVLAMARSTPCRTA